MKKKEPFICCEYCQKSWKALGTHTRPNTTIAGNIRNLIKENRRLEESLEMVRKSLDRFKEPRSIHWNTRQEPDRSIQEALDEIDRAMDKPIS